MTPARPDQSGLRLHRVVLAILLAVGWSALGTAAGAQPTNSLTIAEVDTQNYPQVRATVSVPNELVGIALEGDAFTVRENGQERTFDLQRLPDDDLAVLLLIDTSGSMRGAAIEAAKAAALEFVDRMPPGVSVAVVGFDTAPLTATPFTTDKAAQRDAITGLTAARQTALYDALVAGLDMFPQGDGLRRAIVLLSDGGDKVSQRQLPEVAADLQRSGVPVDIIGLATDESDPGALGVLAQASNGRVVSTSDPASLSALYAGIAARLVNRYALQFTATQYGPTDLNIRVGQAGVIAESTRTVEFPPTPAQPSPSSTPTPLPALRRGTVTVLSWLAQPWVVYFGAACIFLAVTLLGAIVFIPALPQRRLAAGRSATGLPVIDRLRDRAVTFAERGLERRGNTTGINTRLEQAGLALRPGEYLVTVWASALLVTVLASVFMGGLLIAITAGALTLFAGRSLVKVLAQRRQAAFAAQLGDTLQLLAGSLRAGYGLQQAIDAVAREAELPTSAEFRRLLVENRLGRDFDTALMALAGRVELEEFSWVVQAMQIHREVGGDLAEILDAIAATMRQRDEVRRQVSALSAEGRLSAYVLTALPLGVAFMLNIIQPGYLGELTQTTAGWVMLVGAGVLMALGGLWIRRLTRVVY